MSVKTRSWRVFPNRTAAERTQQSGVDLPLTRACSTHFLFLDTASTWVLIQLAIDLQTITCRIHRLLYLGRERYKSDHAGSQYLMLKRKVVR